MKRLSLIIILFITAFTASACGSPAQKELTPVTLMLDWVPNTNHTGIFVAQAKEYFKEAGLAVKIIQPGEVYPEAAVAGGAGDCSGGTAEGDATVVLWVPLAGGCKPNAAPVVPALIRTARVSGDCSRWRRPCRQAWVFRIRVESK